jgi:hypothetical protein
MPDKQRSGTWDRTGRAWERGRERDLHEHLCEGGRNASPTQPLFTPEDRPRYPPGPFALLIAFEQTNLRYQVALDRRKMDKRRKPVPLLSAPFARAVIREGGREGGRERGRERGEGGGDDKEREQAQRGVAGCAGGRGTDGRGAPPPSMCVSVSVCFSFTLSLSITHSIYLSIYLFISHSPLSLSLSLPPSLSL